jgi:hypothetical protein
VRRAKLAPAMISMPGHRGPRRRQRGALPAWLPSGQARAEPLRDDPFGSALSAARDRTPPLSRLLRRSPVLAGRGVSLSVWPCVLLARIVVLALTVCFTWGSIWMGSGRF